MISFLYWNLTPYFMPRTKLASKVKKAKSLIKSLPAKKKISAKKSHKILPKVKLHVRSAMRKRISVPKESWIDTVSPLSILVIGLLVVVFSAASSLFVDTQQWANLPSSIANFSPWIFQYILTAIFSLVAVSIVLIWNMREYKRAFLAWLFLLMGILHVTWNMFFFAFHVTDASFMIAFAQSILVFVVFLVSWRRSRLAAMLFLPYLLWIIGIMILSSWTYFIS